MGKGHKFLGEIYRFRPLYVQEGSTPEMVNRYVDQNGVERVTGVAADLRQSQTYPRARLDCMVLDRIDKSSDHV